MGTTVRLTDLFRSVPVRKQTALKTTAKCLTKLKRILHAYAFARPSTRLSLRILKAKNDKSNWMYSPKAGASVEDAALKIAGRECTGQCLWSSLAHEGFTIQAFLPKASADPTKISNVGHFLSIDSRPMATSRPGSILSKIFKLFREKLKFCNSNFNDIKDPFMCMNVFCPEGSYDSNIEPAKDDVVFDDTEMVLTAARKCFDQVYPVSYPELAYFQAESQRENPHTSSTGHSRHISSESPRTSPTLVHNDAEPVRERPSKRQCTWRRNMYGTDDEDADELLRPQAQRTTASEGGSDAEGNDEATDNTTSNPWIMAKMTAPVRRQIDPVSRPLRERSSSDQNSSPKLPQHKKTTMPAHPPWNLPTPLASSSPARPGTATGPALRGDERWVRDTASGVDNIFDDNSEPNREAQTFQARRRLGAPQHQPQWTAVNDFLPAGRLPLNLAPHVHDPDEFTSPLQSNQSQDVTNTIGRPHFASHADKVFPGITAANIRKPLRSPPKPATRLSNTHQDSSHALSSSPQRSPPKRRDATKDGDIRDILQSNPSGPLLQEQQTDSGSGSTILRRRRHHLAPADSSHSEEAMEEEEPEPTSSALEAIDDSNSLHPRIRRVLGPPPPSSSPFQTSATRDQPPRPRTKSSTAQPLPLERIPPGCWLGDTVTSIHVTVSQLCDLARRLSALGLAQNEGGRDVFDAPSADGASASPSALVVPAAGEREVEGWRRELVGFLREHDGGEEEEVGLGHGGEDVAMGFGEWAARAAGEAGEMGDGICAVVL